MAEKNIKQADQTDPPALYPFTPVTPSHGGSYTLDDTTGEHILIERTQPKEPA